ncbi:Hsp20/alpha crystallin family protein [Candidatus Bathyarchaeota archaeon]|nr:Hsp20/alpha crystallin family protein [Candidatus Bathyarchaeota archaeon]
MAKTQAKSGAVSPSGPGTSLATQGNASLTGLNRGFDNIFDQFKRSFDDLLAPFAPFTTISPAWAEQAVRYPFVDLVDQGDHYLVTAELPGFTKEMVNVQVNKDALELRAENKTDKEEKGKNYLHRERAYSAFQRTIAFPEEVKPAQVEGIMKNGVLELRIPKREPKPEERMTKVELR